MGGGRERMGQRVAQDKFPLTFLDSSRASIYTCSATIKATENVKARIRPIVDDLKIT